MKQLYMARLWKWFASMSYIKKLRGLLKNKEPTYLFMHLPKTAGTSLRNMLERNYDKDQLLYIYQEPPGVSLETIEKYDNNTLDNVRLMYGHFPFGAHELVDCNRMQYITMLRDPVQRVISTYYHFKNVSSVHSEKFSSNRISMSEFISNGEFLEVDNAMVRLISGVKHVSFGECSNETYEIAINNLNKYFAEVLILEKMDESLSRLQKLLNLSDITISRDNVNKQLERAAVDEGVIDQIRDLNKYDVMLYKYVLRGFKMKATID